jgi:DNA-binding CsgD family transcriptional regulator
MSQLSATDLRAVLALAFEARSFADLQSYRTGVLPGLLQLVPADVAGYNEVDSKRGTTVVVSHPADAFFDGVEERFASVVHQHPLIERAHAGDRATYTISDFLTERAYHGLELYHDMYRQIDTEDQIAFALPGEPIIGLALNRPSRSFSERDREVLELLRPHLAQAYVETSRREEANALIEVLGSALEATCGAAIVVDRHGRIGYATEAARGVLSERFGAAGATLPPELSDWLAAADPDRPNVPLAIEHDDGRMLIHQLPIRAGLPETLLMLEHEHEHARLPSVDSLRRIGLTRRQAEVLRLVCAGEPDARIASELSISRPTVRKHLEHIYSRLGVNSRTAAAARAHAAPRVVGCG